jgi:glycerol uptake facilitator-like aquaporin
MLAEFVGTAVLVTVVVGSGIAAAQLSPSDVGLQLLENSIATAFGLAVLILLFGPVSGAHFNPVVSAADWLLGRRADAGITGGAVAAYAAAQVVGGIVGAVLANLSSSRSTPTQGKLPIGPSYRTTPNHGVNHDHAHRAVLVHPQRWALADEEDRRPARRAMQVRRRHQLG